MKGLTKAEERIMQILWKLDEGVLKDITNKTTHPKLHSNTVATQLKRLEQKEFVEFEFIGMYKLYRPKIRQLEYSRTITEELLNSYFEGSPIRLVSAIINDRHISIKELLDELKSCNNQSS